VARSETTPRKSCPGCGGEGVPAAGYESVELDRCRDCGLIFLGRDHLGGTEAKYASGEYAETHAEYFEEEDSFSHIAERRLAWLRDKSVGSRLLEVGPGRGHFLGAAREAGFDVVGVEASPSLAARIAADIGVPVKTGTLDEVELPSHGFDLVCMFHVFEHVEDPPGVLARIRELLDDDGLLAIEVPNIGSAMAARRGDTWGAVQPVDLHISHFTPPTLRSLVERSGFTVRELDTIGIWPYLPPSRRLRPRALLGYGYRALTLRTLRGTHPTGMDNLRLLASPSG
jgi:SAM-dependent methyltransferase